MKSDHIEGATRVIGEAQGYIGLAVRDVVINCTVDGPGTPAMETAWLLDADERRRIAGGAPLLLRILGTVHPPVMLFVCDAPVTGPNVTSAARDLVESAGDLLASGVVGPKSKPMIERLRSELAFRLDHPQVVAPDGRQVYSKADYDLGERENESLRRHLAWAGKQLPAEARVELAKRLDAKLDAGGVVADSVEEEREEILRALLMLKRLADHLDKGANGKTGGMWPAQADSLVNQARAYEPILDATLAEIRRSGDRG